MDGVYDRIKKIIVKQLNIDAEHVTEDASFIEDLGADSIDSVELIMAFEVEFSIEISEEDAERLLTVSDVISYVESKM